MIAAIVIIIGVYGLWMMHSRAYRKWFRLSSHRNDSLRLRGVIQEVAVVLDQEGFELPPGVPRSGQTVLLSISLTASIMGRFRAPYIEVMSRRRNYRQYFELGAKGQRYLNLTPIFQSSESGSAPRIAISSSSVRWASQARLLIFAAPIAETGNVLVLAPHPDDAEIAAFGMYSSHRSWVVTLTAGEKGTGNLPMEMNAAARTDLAASLRIAESLSIPQAAGVPPQQCANLVLPDGGLRLMAREPARPFRLACESSLPRSKLRAENRIPELRIGDAECSWNELIVEIRLLLSLSRPNIVLCPHPLLDSHSDHVYTTVALAQALRGLDGPCPVIFLYVVHTEGVPAYPLGPMQSLVGVPSGRADAWSCESVYSHMLEPAVQRAKYLAIASTHAARVYEDVELRLWARIKKLAGRLPALFSGTFADPTSFLRRAPRPNEMYFVVAGDSLATLIAQNSELRAVLG